MITTQHVITRNDLRSHRQTLYVFGDNDLRQGFGGQAAAMRGEPNAIGIRTKAAPSWGANAFWSDATYELNARKLDEDFAPLFAHPGNIVIPSSGLGTGRAQLQQRAPQTYAYLQNLLHQLTA